MRGARLVLPFLVSVLLARTRAAAIVLHHRVVTSAGVRRAHDLGVPVVAWTVDSPVDLRRVVEAGVDAVVTNHPGIVSTLET
jgi:glycerophosphoryl diester phosphodiesterase